MSVIFDVVFLGIIIAAAIIGYCRGFVKSVTGLVIVAAALLAAQYFSPFLSPIVREKVIGNKMEELVSSQFSPLVDKENEQQTFDDLFAIAEEKDNPLTAILNRFGVSAEDAKERYDEFVAEKKEDLSSAMTKYVAEPLADRLATAISYAAVFIAAYIILKLLSLLLNFVVSKTPVLSGLNKFAGLVFGAAGGIIIAYAVFFLLNLFYPSLRASFPTTFTDAARDSSVMLGLLAKFNLFA